MSGSSSELNGYSTCDPVTVALGHDVVPRVRLTFSIRDQPPFDLDRRDGTSLLRGDVGSFHGWTATIET